jgi:glucose-6-phosphate isomerase/transaldolase/glucose-6-phosphate isomerase
MKKYFNESLVVLREQKVVQRIWERDHTVWQPEPTEIDNRLGWLELPEDTLSKLSDLETRVAKLLESKPTDVVLLGMGGSSLCPEVFRRTIGSAPGYPRLHVLDSTAPDWVMQVTCNIHLESTYFIVASKSGGTIEPMSGFHHFWKLVADKNPDPGKQFIAITDPNTGLGTLAAEKGFIETFVNRPDVGGRFSALSFFGMVPALLMGIDARQLLERARWMESGCRSLNLEENPGVQLGVLMAAGLQVGRDKVTLLSDSTYASLGLWVEQLIAESTGKEGKGIFPVATEPILDVEYYGKDRLFVGVQSTGSNALNKQLAALVDAGHPTLLIEVSDPIEIGAEFFRWEIATVVASHFLAINPYDQPNVQLAKTRSIQIIKDFEQTGTLVEPPLSNLSLQEFLQGVRPPQFLAIMPYIVETPETESALLQLRHTVSTKYQITTTSGYGPRFLHSTGQYHKGGPNNGLFLQILGGNLEPDGMVPGMKYGFRVLCRAQALGDNQALLDTGRKVLRVELHGDYARGIQALADTL